MTNTEPTPAPYLPSADPIGTVRLWLLVPVTVTAGAAAMAILPGLSPPAFQDQVVLSTMLGAVVGWWLLVVRRATRSAGFRPQRPMTAAVLKLSLSVALAGICAALLWTLLKNALTLTTAGLVTAPSFSATEPTFAALATAALTFTLLGPIAEELFFRDALFRKLRLRWSPVKVALALSLLFGLGHSDPPASGLFGLAMLVLYTKTRVVWAPIIGHVANNLVPFTLDNLIRVLPRSALEAMVGRPAKFVTLVPAVLGTLWLLRFLRDNWHTLGDPLHGVRSETGREPTPGSQTDGAAG